MWRWEKSKACQTGQYFPDCHWEINATFSQTYQRDTICQEFGRLPVQHTVQQLLLWAEGKYSFIHFNQKLAKVICKIVSQLFLKNSSKTSISRERSADSGNSKFLTYLLSPEEKEIWLNRYEWNSYKHEIFDLLFMIIIIILLVRKRRSNKCFKRQDLKWPGITGEIALSKKPAFRRTITNQ